MTQQTNPSQDPITEPVDNSIIGRIRAWLQPPVFPDDDEKTRHAAIVNPILLVALVLGILYGLILPWDTGNSVPIILFYITVIGLMVFGLVNLRRGNVVGTTYIVATGAWLLIATVSVFFGGVASPIFATFIIVILIIGLVIGNRAAVVYTTATIAFGGILLWLGNAGAITEYQGAPFTYLARYSFVIVTATFLMYLTNRNFAFQLNKSEQTRTEFDARVRELEASLTSFEDDLGSVGMVEERRKKYLEAAARIAEDTITAADLDSMLDRIVGQIATFFGFYHVGIFLTDENDQWAVLRAVSSEGGRQMMARHHQLGVGKQGIVGFVTGIGQARITQDIDLDRIHSVTTELPETRSEMALPLKVRNQIIGALDIQDNIPNAFQEEDISALQILANQIALAVNNFHLTSEAQERRDEVQRVYGEYSQRAWAETHRQKALSGYLFSDGNLVPVNDPQLSLSTENKVEVPILVRGKSIGVIEIAKDTTSLDWTPEEKELLETLSDQLGIALDSARLFNETQLRASTEKIIGDINADIMESLEIDSILKTTVAKLQQTLELPEVSIKMTAPDSHPPSSGNGSPVDVDAND